jgi:sulfonate transport system substrate-binding protein
LKKTEDQLSDWTAKGHEKIFIFSCLFYSLIGELGNEGGVKMPKKSYLLIMVSIIMLFLLAGCSTGVKEASGNEDSQGNETSKIRFGIDAGISTLPFRVAEEQGYFNKSGLEPTIASFAYGIDTINALFTEQTDTGFAADYPILNSLGKGDLVILGTISKSTEQTNKDIALFATGNIKSGKDLKGKKLGVAKGTVYEYIWSKY